MLKQFEILIAAIIDVQLCAIREAKKMYETPDLPKEILEIATVSACRTLSVFRELGLESIYEGSKSYDEIIEAYKFMDQMKE